MIIVLISWHMCFNLSVSSQIWFLLLYVQGMVEVVAENYHNIWSKKKKAELISKGV